MSSALPLTQLADVAERQHGCLTRAQALEAGYSRSGISRRLSTREWERLLPGVYRIAGTERNLLQAVMAAVLWAGSGSFASHRTAGYLMGLDGIDPGPIEVSAPRRMKSPSTDLIFHKVGPSEANERGVIEGIPVTAAARTLIDLAMFLDENQLTACLESALRGRLVSVARMRWELRQDRALNQPGIAKLRKILASMSPETPSTGSVLEVEAERLFRSGRLPMPHRQFNVVEGGKFLARVDFAYPALKIAIEIDGFAYHSSPSDFQRDRERLNALLANGWIVIHVTNEHLKRKRLEIIAEIRRVLRLRGN